MKINKILIWLVIITYFCTPAIASFEDTVRSIRPELEKINPDRIDGITNQVTALSQSYYIDPYLILAIIDVESDLRNVKGDKSLKRKACGYMQIQVRTFKKVMKYNTTCDRIISDWPEGLRAGVKYLKHLEREHGLLVGISRYNGGYENLQYVHKVLNSYYKLKRLQ